MSGSCGREAAMRQSPCVPSLAPQFDQDSAWANLERIVAIGPRPSGTMKNQMMRDLIVEQLTDYGLEPVRETFQDRTPIGELTFENIYVDLPGRPRGEQSPPMVVLCTHFDTKRMAFPFSGANDGASGTAVLLELARVLATEPGEVTWRVLFLDGEEAVRPQWLDPDNRYGSRHHVRGLQKTGLAARVKACVLIDLVGDKDLRFNTELYSDRRLLELFFDAAKAHGLGRHVDGRSQEIKDDHLSFLAANIPSVDLIDFDYGPSNRYWHTPDDIVDNCSAASLGAAGRILLYGLADLEPWALKP
jgi:hypothetical protein